MAIHRGISTCDHVGSHEKLHFNKISFVERREHNGRGNVSLSITSDGCVVFGE